MTAHTIMTALIMIVRTIMTALIMIVHTIMTVNAQTYESRTIHQIF